LSKKWRAGGLKERSAAQEHFIDLCHLLDEPTPAEADPDGSGYAFEKGAAKAGGGDGWADVWKRGCFAWEYKGKGRDLKAAFKQLQTCAPSLDHPPLLIEPTITDPLPNEWRGPQSHRRPAGIRPRQPSRAFSNGCTPFACWTPPAAPAISSTSACVPSRTWGTTSSPTPRPWDCTVNSRVSGPQNVHGLEINPYAAELTRVGGACPWSASAPGDHGRPVRLDGEEVEGIHADPTASTGGADRNVSQATKIPDNRNVAYVGIQKTGPFEIPGELAQQWLKLPNPYDRPNSTLVHHFRA